MASIKTDFSALVSFLREQAEGDLLPLREQQAATEAFETSFAEVEKAALKAGLSPARYQRNRQTISTSDQLTLLGSTVAIVGCGGLGGYIVEELARLGVGRLVVIDPDVFEEHNLNRQLLSSTADLGRPKVEVAAERIAEINPAVEVLAIRDAFSGSGRTTIHGADVVVDALDSIPVRLELASACGDLGIPLVHGTIAGWHGHVATQYPGENTLGILYGRCAEEKGVERQAGNPAFTPAVVASLEVAEVCKVLLHKGTRLRGGMLIVNLLHMEFERILF